MYIHIKENGTQQDQKTNNDTLLNMNESQNHYAKQGKPLYKAAHSGAIPIIWSPGIDFRKLEN